MKIGDEVRALVDINMTITKNTIYVVKQIGPISVEVIDNIGLGVTLLRGDFEKIEIAKDGDIIEMVKIPFYALPFLDITKKYKVKKKGGLTIIENNAIDVNVFAADYRIVGRKHNIMINPSPTIPITSMPRTTPSYAIGEQDEWKQEYNIPTKQNVCECGAKHTSRPNYHSDWCPMSKEQEEPLKDWWLS